MFKKALFNPEYCRTGNANTIMWPKMYVRKQIFWLLPFGNNPVEDLAWVVNASWYVLNAVIQSDLQTPRVKEEIHKIIL
jgi:hypothetical protein